MRFPRLFLHMTSITSMSAYLFKDNTVSLISCLSILLLKRVSRQRVCFVLQTRVLLSVSCRNQQCLELLSIFLQGLTVDEENIKCDNLSGWKLNLLFQTFLVNTIKKSLDLSFLQCSESSSIYLGGSDLHPSKKTAFQCFSVTESSDEHRCSICSADFTWGHFRAPMTSRFPFFMVTVLYNYGLCVAVYTELFIYGICPYSNQNIVQLKIYFLPSLLCFHTTCSQWCCIDTFFFAR